MLDILRSPIRAQETYLSPTSWTIELCFQKKKNIEIGQTTSKTGEIEI